MLVFTTIILCFNYPAFARGGGGGHSGGHSSGGHSSSGHVSNGTSHVNSGVSHSSTQHVASPRQHIPTQRASIPRAPAPKAPVVHVKTYVKPKSGEVVMAHNRTAPNGTQRDNFSSKPNINPFNGKPGTITPKK